MDYPITSILLEEKVNRYAYLMMNEDSSVLIVPGAKHDAPTLLTALKEHMDIPNLSYIIL